LHAANGRFSRIEDAVAVRVVIDKAFQAAQPLAEIEVHAVPAGFRQVGLREVDIADLIRLDGPGYLLWPGRRGPVLLSQATVERLSCDADTTVVLRHDGHIVGTLSDERYATREQRKALYARDRHCRFPGCTAPVDGGIIQRLTSFIIHMNLQGE
jgi:hypothetical protein